MEIPSRIPKCIIHLLPFELWRSVSYYINAFLIADKLCFPRKTNINSLICYQYQYEHDVHTWIITYYSSTVVIAHWFNDYGEEIVFDSRPQQPRPHQPQLSTRLWLLPE